MMQCNGIEESNLGKARCSIKFSLGNRQLSTKLSLFDYNIINLLTNGQKIE